ncbi:AAA family ATPase [Aureimonas phyllosphaerae]|uniref:AAA+ ATPase domain-containing protein n=1 Tax=Aureimonas phyllosphaerae TaxID=1166078 RepID=A0A7W6BXJ4_9HYPH|nr:AAA family ATPase [Aureimonas phyllosphaerae]MBB3936550.1 hypothetical protein [Aureimonas phyllosphaerae]MBB3960586.1 hypothetical protein [Aureimonas phyllosphaerae]SFF57863.1 AAA domain-containing protein [Aureimonas phyllosphaerae]
MSQPKLPGNWQRIAQVVPYEGDDLQTAQQEVVRQLPSIKVAVDNGWEILINVASSSEYERGSQRTIITVKVEFWANGTLLYAQTAFDLANAIDIAKIYAARLPNAYVIFGSGANVPRALALTSARDLLSNVPPALTWHVPGLMPAGQVTLLSGDGGTGKSLVALQLAAATAAGRSWLGLQPATGGALVVSAEDDEDEIHRRLTSICNAEGIGDAELEELHVHSLVGEDPLLGVLNPDTRSIEPTPLFLTLERAVRDLRPALLVLDTLADLFGGDENVRSQARQFVGLLRSLTMGGETTVLCLAHPSVAGINSGTGSSGSTGWSNSVRSRLYLERVMEWRGKGDNRRFVEPNPNARLLTTKKANYGPSGGAISLRWNNGVMERQELPVIENIPLLSVKETSEETAARVDVKFLELLAAFTAEGRNVSPSPSAAYGPALFAKHGHADGIKKTAFVASLRRLLDAGRVVVEAYGPPSRGTRRLLIAADGGGADGAAPPADVGAD